MHTWINSTLRSIVPVHKGILSYLQYKSSAHLSIQEGSQSDTLQRMLINSGGESIACVCLFISSVEKSDLHNRKVTFLFPNHSTNTYVVGIQKNRLNNMVLLSTQNICLKLWVRTYLKFYSELCLSKRVKQYPSQH